jgi:hypothetical protein
MGNQFTSLIQLRASEESDSLASFIQLRKSKE